MSRLEIAHYLNTLLTLYIICIFARILASWLPSIPTRIQPVVKFVSDLTDPYLNLFRRVIPPVGMFDFSPILAILALQIAGRAIISAVAGV